MANATVVTSIPSPASLSAAAVMTRGLAAFLENRLLVLVDGEARRVETLIEESPELWAEDIAED